MSRWISFRQCLCECRCIYIYTVYTFLLDWACPSHLSVLLCRSFIIKEFQGVCSSQTSAGETNKHSLDPCREADDREEEPVCVEIFKHALNRLSVDPERDAGSSQVQTTAHHILWGQDVLVHWRNRPRDTTCSGHTHKHTHSYVKYDPVSDAGTDHVCLTHTGLNTNLCTQMHTVTHTLGKEIVPAGYWFCLDTIWP